MMIEETAQYIQSRLGDFHPQTAIILGSGLGGLASSIQSPITIPYSEIPSFPQTTVTGHAGKLIAGFVEDHPIICMQGRFHLYEGLNPQVINFVIQVLKIPGIKNLIVTNAAGSLNPDFAPGSIMMITDHINFSARNPLIGPDDQKYGPRFPSMLNAYTPSLREKMHTIAKQFNIPLHEGVYLMVLGPNFETAAEIKAFRTLGADAVGMSTVPEVICAVRCGINVLGLSVITNFGTGMTKEPLSHEETLQQSQNAGANLKLLIEHFLKETKNG